MRQQAQSYARACNDLAHGRAPQLQSSIRPYHRRRSVGAVRPGQRSAAFSLVGCNLREPKAPAALATVRECEVRLVHGWDAAKSLRKVRFAVDQN